MVPTTDTLDTAPEISCRIARSALRPPISEFSEALRDFGECHYAGRATLHVHFYYPADLSMSFPQCAMTRALARFLRRM